MKKLISLFTCFVIVFSSLSFVSVSAEKELEKEFSCCNLYQTFKFNEICFDEETTSKDVRVSFEDNSVLLQPETNANEYKVYFNVENPEKIGAILNNYFQNDIVDYELYSAFKVKGNKITGFTDIKLCMGIYKEDDSCIVKTQNYMVNAMDYNTLTLTRFIHNFSEAKYIYIEISCANTDLTDSIITIAPIRCRYAFAEHDIIIVEQVSSTCTMPGSTGRMYCNVCKQYFTSNTTIAPLGHTPVTDKAVAATCEKTGLTEGKHCAECKKVIIKQQVIPAIGHKYKWVTKKKATYFENGKQEYKCTGCGKVINTAVTSKKKLEVPSFSLISANKAFKLKYKTVSDATGFQIKYKTGNKTHKVSVNSKKSITKTVSNLKKERTYKVWIRSYRKIGEKTVYSSWSTAKKVKTK